MLIRYGTDKKGKPVKKAVIYTKEEHKIPLNKIDSNAVYIVRRLKENGYEAYIVGGSVRDLIIGRTPKDFDIVTDAVPVKIRRIFKNSRIIGKRFRLVHIVFGDQIYETSTFRSTVEGSVGNEFGCIDEDVQRRDFSINALYYDPIKEQVIDYVNGFEDLKNGVLSPIIPLERIFIEDPVRMIRAVKYSVTTNCKMNHKLEKKILKSSSLLIPISPSRLTEELLKIINCGKSYEIIRKAIELGIYEYLQPAATEMILENKKFQEKYFTSLKQLDELVSKNSDIRLGEKLVFLLQDFVASLTDWNLEQKYTVSTGELYKNTWTSCRNFILPMNPPRIELDYAIRKILTGVGVKVKTKKRTPKAPANQNKETKAKN